VLSYRALAIWLPAPVGLAALGGLRKTVARWGAEVEPPAAPAPAAAPVAGRGWAPGREPALNPA
jgi:hypothetical protein